LQNTVLDSYAVLAFLFDEPGAQQVEVLLTQAAEENMEVLMSAVNWAEVLYGVKKVHGETGLEAAREFDASMPVRIVPVDRALAEKAANLKADYRLSLADAFAAALAMQHDAVLISGDPEFKQLEKKLNIHWLQPRQRKK
jgi:PIN domain nuclease of toxin-antitoxin system